MSSHVRVVVVGAGVSGLTTALVLARNSSRYQITVVAKHMPGDLDSVEYASPWAGANYMPAGVKDSSEAKYERETWPYLYDLALNHPEAGIHVQDARIYNREKSEQSSVEKSFATLTDEEAWWREVVPNYSQIDTRELPSGSSSGTEFTSVCINTSHYLHYLMSRLLEIGVVFKRGVFKHLYDARSTHHSGSSADIIINCTGLMACKLGGVMDEAVIPARGQTVLVRNEVNVQSSITGVPQYDDEVVYHMTRAAGGGTILGGCYQLGNWSSEVDMEMAERIMERAVALHPNLTKDGLLDVIRHNVGLRPVRKTGFRVEKELLERNAGEQVNVVHNYGHGGAGYQASYGCALKVVQLVNEVTDLVMPKANGT